MLTQSQPYAESSGLSNLEGAGCGNSRSKLLLAKYRAYAHCPGHERKAWYVNHQLASASFCRVYTVHLRPFEAHANYAATSTSFARPVVLVARSLAPAMDAAARHPARGLLARLSRPRRSDRCNHPKLSAELHVQRPGTQPVWSFPLGAGDHRPLLPAKLKNSGRRLRWWQGNYRPPQPWVPGGWLRLHSTPRRN